MCGRVASSRLAYTAPCGNVSWCSCLDVASSFDYIHTATCGYFGFLRTATCGSLHHSGVQPAPSSGSRRVFRARHPYTPPEGRVW
ncbi:hypothetical protein E2562_009825 [Oryza meyeriana var. granulata]|uniref:Uncharacterized protein n=1 Tax=Oryza meyeriana var. granulata TaxID=110450 RepID=A0A6G1BU27_9ORYZ|nr:hypothetical protein E2562_009825 [Oryza meyeriana var. granulata]